MLTELEKAYLAGVMDSDGWFTIKRDTRAMRKGYGSCPLFQERLGIKQVCPQAIDMLYREFGGHRRIDKSSAKGGKPLHAWSVVCLKAIKVTEALFPYLRIKRAQAEILLALRQLKKRPRKARKAVERKNRWGHMTTYLQPVLSQEQVLERDILYEKIKSLNDSRPHQPRLVG